MKCSEISDARFFALCKHRYHFARIKSLYFLAFSVIQVSIALLFFLHSKGIVKIAKHLFFLILYYQ